MKIETEVWVVPVCGAGKKKQLLPKIYDTKGHAKAGGKMFLRQNLRGTVRVYEPVKLATEIELPDDCGTCIQRFKCYTER